MGIRLGPHSIARAMLTEYIPLRGGAQREPAWHLDGRVVLKIRLAP